MESIVKMGVKPGRDNRGTDPLPTGPAADQMTEPGMAGSGTIAGSDYQFGAGRTDEAALPTAGAGYSPAQRRPP